MLEKSKFMFRSLLTVLPKGKVGLHKVTNSGRGTSNGGIKFAKCANLAPKFYADSKFIALVINKCQEKNIGKNLCEFSLFSELLFFSWILSETYLKTL
jgi:hypothetical protein